MFVNLFVSVITWILPSNGTVETVEIVGEKLLNVSMAMNQTANTQST